MSQCRQEDISNCRRDYWFSTDDDHDSKSRDCRIRPIFPRVLQANLIIPQTIIPIRIVFSPLTTTNLGFGTAVPTVLQTAQNIGLDATNLFDTNLIAGNGIIPGL